MQFIADQLYDAVYDGVRQFLTNRTDFIAFDDAVVAIRVEVKGLLDNIDQIVYKCVDEFFTEDGADIEEGEYCEL